MIGKIINNYVIERKLGGGGMGDVYYAKHNKVDREVAIKVLHSHLFSNESIHNRFKNEANALIKLNHPNIVKIFDYVEQDNFACLIMEYINGYTLDDYISKFTGPLPSTKASSLICSILDAVQYAHDNNIYHRDIKPANIMINKEGNRVLIMDFGIAKLTDSKNFKTTHANTQLGTPFYMSPEQIKGLPYSRMSDIYSLGVTLFEMVTGKCPYHQITSLFELQSKIVNEPLPNTNDFYPGVGIRIQNAILKATQKAPELRFQSCNDFKMYIQDTEALNMTTIVAKPHVVKQSKGNSNGLALIIAGFAVIIVVILAIVFLPANAPPPPPPAPLTGFLIPDSNIALFDKYIARKQVETKLSLSGNEIDSIHKLINQDKDTLSLTEISMRYDHLFDQSALPAPVQDKVKVPSDNKVKKDFLSNLYQGEDICRVTYKEQWQIISIGQIDNPYRYSLSPPNEISITVNFTIASYDDKSETTECAITVRYSKTGNEYKLTSN
ncbi:MAG: serine/threonine-protein kinase [Bacteroidales bacterium]|nr:serine/threonine-protein kinase [Bacteroidales bacterium]